MKLFDMFYKKGQHSDNSVDSYYSNEVTYAFKKAIEYGKSFGKKLDFSGKSIKAVEEILDYYANDLIKAQNTDEPVTENQIWSMALWWGVYLGETLRRNHLQSSKWINDPSMDKFFPILESSSGTFIYPVNKVYKRLVNGKEDNVVSFYDAVASSVE